MWFAIAYKALAVVCDAFGFVSLAERLYQAHRERIATLTEKEATDLKAGKKVSDKIADAAANAPVDDKEVADILGQGKL